MTAAVDRNTVSASARPRRWPFAAGALSFATTRSTIGAGTERRIVRRGWSWAAGPRSRGGGDAALALRGQRVEGGYLGGEWWWPRRMSSKWTGGSRSRRV